MKEPQGFTLVELMVVVVIIGILAAVAVPKLQQSVYKAKASEAPTILSSIAKSEEIRHAEVGTYIAANNNSEIRTKLGITIPNSTFFTYSVTSDSPATFLALATLAKPLGEIASGEGSYVSVNHNNVRQASPGLLYALVKSYVGAPPSDESEEEDEDEEETTSDTFNPLDWFSNWF